MTSSTSSVNPKRKLCKCGEVAVVRTCKKAPNAGKLFYGCPSYDVGLGIGGCGFFKWCPDQSVTSSGVPASFCDYRDVVSTSYLKNENDELRNWVTSVREDNVKLIKDNKFLVDMVKTVNEENQDLKAKMNTMKKRVKDGNRRSGWELKVCVVIVLLVVIACRLM